MDITAQRKTGIRTANAPTPTGPFSQAIRVGNLVFVSGQAGRNRETGQLGDVREQTEWALRNVTAILAEAGATLDDVVKTTVFLTDIADYGTMNDTYVEVFGDHRPARSAVAVSGLPLGALVEVEAWARVG